MAHILKVNIIVDTTCHGIFVFKRILRGSKIHSFVGSIFHVIFVCDICICAIIVLFLIIVQLLFLHWKHLYDLRCISFLPHHLEHRTKHLSICSACEVV